jgi:hypothetical protein
MIKWLFIEFACAHIHYCTSHPHSAVAQRCQLARSLNPPQAYLQVLQLLLAHLHGARRRALVNRILSLIYLHVTRHLDNPFYRNVFGFFSFSLLKGMFQITFMVSKMSCPHIVACDCTKAENHNWNM